MQRIIALIDCDCFFVSCERVKDPKLQGKPVCVMTGGGDKGIIVSRSKEAKALGVKMGEPYFKAKVEHPDAICIPAHHSSLPGADIERFIDNLGKYKNIQTFDDMCSVYLASMQNRNEVIVYNNKRTTHMMQSVLSKCGNLSKDQELSARTFLSGIYSQEQLDTVIEKMKAPNSVIYAVELGCAMSVANIDNIKPLFKYMEQQNNAGIDSLGYERHLNDR